MLAIQRKNDERVRLLTAGGEVIWLTVCHCDRGRCRLLFDAPRNVQIQREELLAPEERCEEKGGAR